MSGHLEQHSADDLALPAPARRVNIRNSTCVLKYNIFILNGYPGGTLSSQNAIVERLLVIACPQKRPYPWVISPIYTPGWDRLFIPRGGITYLYPGWDQVFIPRGGIKYSYPGVGSSIYTPWVGSPIYTPGWAHLSVSLRTRSLGVKMVLRTVFMADKSLSDTAALET